MFESKAAVTALEFSSHIPDLIRSGRGGGSLIEYTRPTRVEPNVLVDMRAAQLPYIDEVLNAGLNIFSAYYLQAISLTVEVGNVNVLKLLDKFNPNRDLARNVSDGLDDFNKYAKSKLSNESFAYGLPFPEQGESIALALEAQSDRAEKDDNVSVGSGSVRLINENANLSLGKLLEISVNSDGQEATFPVQVRLMVNTIRPDLMAHTLSLGTKTSGGKERFHQWRSGQIKFWRDLVMAQDLIDKHRQDMINDDSGFYKSQSKRASKNALSGVFSKSPSIGTASSMVVMSTDTAKELERAVRGRLKDFRTREKIFAETYSMMFFVIDPDWEQVTIYHRSIEEPTEVSVRELQRSNKRGGGPDIMEILNAFRQAKSPTL